MVMNCTLHIGFDSDFWVSIFTINIAFHSNSIALIYWVVIDSPWIDSYIVISLSAFYRYQGKVGRSFLFISYGCLSISFFLSFLIYLIFIFLLFLLLLLLLFQFFLLLFRDEERETERETEKERERERERGRGKEGEREGGKEERRRGITRPLLTWPTRFLFFLVPFPFLSPIFILFFFFSFHQLTLTSKY